MRAASGGSTRSRKSGLLSRSGLISRTSTDELASASSTTSHSSVLAELIVVGGDPGPAGGLDLVAHQGQQRRHDQRRPGAPRPQQGRSPRSTRPTCPSRCAGRRAPAGGRRPAPRRPPTGRRAARRRRARRAPAARFSASSRMTGDPTEGVSRRSRDRGTRRRPTIAAMGQAVRVSDDGAVRRLTLCRPGRVQHDHAAAARRAGRGARRRPGRPRRAGDPARRRGPGVLRRLRARLVDCRPGPDDDARPSGRGTAPPTST